MKKRKEKNDKSKRSFSEKNVLIILLEHQRANRILLYIYIKYIYKKEGILYNETLHL